jgi:hypothetical protein
MRYREQHRCGMKALERHDFAALEAAIRGEREIIEEQMRLLEELRALGTARKDAPHVS